MSFEFTITKFFPFDQQMHVRLPIANNLPAQIRMKQAICANDQVLAKIRRLAEVDYVNQAFKEFRASVHYYI